MRRASLIMNNACSLTRRGAEFSGADFSPDMTHPLRGAWSSIAIKARDVPARHVTEHLRTRRMVKGRRCADNDGLRYLAARHDKDNVSELVSDLKNRAFETLLAESFFDAGSPIGQSRRKVWKLQPVRIRHKIVPLPDIEIVAGQRRHP